MLNCDYYYFFFRSGISKSTGYADSVAAESESESESDEDKVKEREDIRQERRREREREYRLSRMGAEQRAKHLARLVLHLDSSAILFGTLFTILFFYFFIL